MKIVILAAGLGKRFRRIDLPKPLTKLIDGRTILATQLEALSHYFSLKDVIVVVGYRKEKVMELFPDLLYVYNPRVEIENTAKSLLRALSKIDDDLLWLNGDVVFHHTVLEQLVAAKQNRMIVNVGPVGDEEVKYRADKAGRILEVSKLVKNAQGEALGINFFNKKDLGLLKTNLEKCSDYDYFEKALELCLEDGISIWAEKVSPELCVEVDFPEDLDKANQLIQMWR